MLPSAKDRVRSAQKNCGYDIPPTQITINLRPADIQKEGSGFDLPMALGILGAYGGLNKKEIPDALFSGRAFPRRQPARCAWRVADRD